MRNFQRITHLINIPNYYINIYLNTVMECQRPSSTLVSLSRMIVSPLPKLNLKWTKPACNPTATKSEEVVISRWPVHIRRPSEESVRNLNSMSNLSPIILQWKYRYHIYQFRNNYVCITFILLSKPIKVDIIDTVITFQ